MNDTTFEMFCKQHQWWSECSGLRTYGVEQMENIYSDLVRTFVRACTSRLCTEKQIKQMESFMSAVTIEQEMRQAYRMGVLTKGMGTEAVGE